MALILNIDTALDAACVALAKDGELILSASNDSQKDHATWLQPAIQELMSEAGFSMRHLHAVGVNIGPGSYTGLRIGLASAKGICYALGLPLVTETSLRLMSFSAIEFLKKTSALTKGLVFCPMIDARRMEVFTALYDPELNELMKPQPCILSAHSFEDQLGRQKILFLGNGSEKFESICQSPNAIFKKVPLSAHGLCKLTYKSFIGNNFAELNYTEPLYTKEFFAIATQKK